MKKYIALLGIAAVLASCASNKNSATNKEPDFYQKIKNVPDSIKVGEITVLNLFKHQILAHETPEYDSLRIVEKVYKPHKELWNNCYGMIFGEENAPKFNTPEGMMEWNKKWYKENKIFFDQRVSELLKMDLEKMIKNNLLKFEKLVPYIPKAKISILLTPITGIGFGGCEAEQFALELNNKTLDVAYTVEKGLPHELNHLVYEKFRDEDP